MAVIKKGKVTWLTGEDAEEFDWGECFISAKMLKNAKRPALIEIETGTPPAEPQQSPADPSDRSA